MDDENSIVEEKPNSLFAVDRTFLKKILGRKSLVDQSRRMFYTENVVSVPFDWEKQPGTPNHAQTEITPLIRPPPAVQSQTLEKPRFTSTTHTTMSCFWKRPGRIIVNARRQLKLKAVEEIFMVCKGNNTPESVESSDGNIESMLLFDHARSSSSLVSTSSTFSNGTTSSSSSRLRSFAKGLIKWSF